MNITQHIKDLYDTVVTLIGSTLNTSATAQTKLGDLTIGETISITSWEYSGTTITINTSAIHNLIAGQYFSVSGLVATTNAPNGRWQVATVEDTDEITFTADDTPTGTPTVSSAELSHGDITLKGAFKEFDLGQTWQDVTGSRTSGVTYTNNTGRPIEIMVTTNATTNFEVGGLKVCHVQATTYEPVSIMVPNNTTYEMISGSVVYWAELR